MDPLDYIYQYSSASGDGQTFVSFVWICVYLLPDRECMVATRFAIVTLLDGETLVPIVLVTLSDERAMKEEKNISII